MQNAKYPWTKGKARPVRRVAMFDKSIAGTLPWWSLVDHDDININININMNIK